MKKKVGTIKKIHLWSSKKSCQHKNSLMEFDKFSKKSYQLMEWAALMVWRAAAAALLALITEGQPVLVGTGDS